MQNKIWRIFVFTVMIKERNSSMPMLEKDINATKNTLPKDWEESNQSYTLSDVFNAYCDGREAGKNAERQKFHQEFVANLKLATSIAEEFYAIALEKFLKLNEIHLKADSLNSFEVLFLADKDIFLEDRFREAYILSRQLLDKYQTTRLNLTFSFTPDTENIDLETLNSDGFIIRYEKGKKD